MLPPRTFSWSAIYISPTCYNGDIGLTTSGKNGEKATTQKAMFPEINASDTSADVNESCHRGNVLARGKADASMPGNSRSPPR